MHLKYLDYKNKKEKGNSKEKRRTYWGGAKHSGYWMHFRCMTYSFLEHTDSENKGTLRLDSIPSGDLIPTSRLVIRAKWK